ncbi:hypothetical protein [Nocardioides sp. InS609-2]|uniref:hypothetical protein n=1 Tax=Nocardioides sp. InS609-2 TaxID=2760705 RepID=UPI0020BF532D|nr:hypothetical protein [Nocardioides sp. InS609-2]
MTTQPASYASERLPDRYIRDVTRRLPEDQRADISAELGASIADRVESMRRERPGTSLAQAEYAALVELGDPVRLAAAYSGRVAQLIGPEVYPVYVRVLRAMLWVAVPPAVTLTTLADISRGESTGALVGGAVWMALTVVVQIVFWITVVFALVERGGESRDLQGSVAAWTPDHLPDSLGESRGSLMDMAANLTWFGFLGAAIVWQQLSSPVTAGGERMPLLDPHLWSTWLPVVLVTVIVSMAFEVVRCRAGGWSRTLAAVNVVVGALFTAPLVYLAVAERLFNPAMLAAVDDDGAFSGGSSWILAFLLLLVWVWNSVEGWRKARSEQSRIPSVGAPVTNH